VSTPDPTLEMEHAVTRVAWLSRSQKPPFLPEERLSLEEALTGFTSGTAFVNHLDHLTGTVEAGKLADLTILDRDVFDPGAGPIGEACVQATFVEGVAVYEATGLDG